MARQRKHAPLRVLLNNRLVGYLNKASGGAIDFRYDDAWLGWENAIPVSLSLPLREDAYKGEPVVAVFENLLPDSNDLRKLVAARVGADGTDAYSLLAQIGRDCVGALQFIPDDADNVPSLAGIDGEAIGEQDIEQLLKNLSRAPLGLGEDEEFRISMAGAQEKTALLWHEGQWLKPHGTTPTTHIFKTRIGTLQNGIDLSNSVENEYYCLKLLAAFGLPVNIAEILTFGETKALVIERFDRQMTKDGRLLRVPQEDFCQVLSCPPTRKYQNEGGPGMADILDRLKASDTPADDQKKFLKAQILFWLTGATDGHAKNFSVFLGAGGAFSLTPFYDVLTAQPSLDARQMERKQMKLAMFAGDGRHYRIDEIQGRHFVQTTERAGLPGALATEVLEEVARTADGALEAAAKQLPKGFPEEIHASVLKGFTTRLRSI
jgi:serine/threonine-protein kinase HipA